MHASNTPPNGSLTHWVTVHADAAGQFTAQAVGLPEVRATAATLEEALARLRERLRAMMASGALVAIELSVEKPPLSSSRWDPNDPEMLAFMAILDQESKEDLEKTLQELDQECSNSSSTPTT